MNASSWAFGAKDEHEMKRVKRAVERQETVDREQAALATIERADPEFARVLTRKLVPDQPVENPDVIRRVIR